MEERLPLLEHGARAGELLRREEGLHTVFSASCPGRGGGEVRKVWLRGPGGNALLLGTLLPEGGEWRLERRLTRSDLERRGLDRDLWGEILPGEEIPEAGKGPSGAEECAPEDPLIARLLSGVPKSCICREEGGWRISFSWSVGQPVPLVPLFCFAHPEPGRLVYHLDGRGFPRRVLEKKC